MYCRNCGKCLKDGQLFCGQCGERIVDNLKPVIQKQKNAEEKTSKYSCCICNSGIKEWIKAKCKDGYICKQCVLKCRINIKKNIKNMGILDVREDMRKQLEQIEKHQFFIPTKKVSSYLMIDDNRKEWVIPDVYGNLDGAIIYDYKDLISYELYEDCDVDETRGGLGRAVVGGVLFGGVGAIVGGSTGKRKTKRVVSSLELHIVVNDKVEPIRHILLLIGSANSDSLRYKFAKDKSKELISVLSIIKQSNDAYNQNSNVSIADEIKKYKELLDIGAISQSEFEIKKNELLNMKI